MPNLTTPPASSNLTPEQIAAAEALVAAALKIPMLARQENVGESGRVGSSGRIVLRLPAVSIQTLTLGGAPAAGVLSSPWLIDVSSLFRSSYGSPWGSGPTSVPYTVTYTAGWTPDDLPEGIRQAILATAAQLEASAGRDAGVIEERMGPVAYRYSDTVRVGSLPADAQSLLTPWLPLRV